LSLIADGPRRTDRDHVFGNSARRKGDGQRGFSGWSKAKAALEERVFEARKMAAIDAGQEGNKVKPLPDWRLHDLRRTAATTMADRLGVLPHIVEAILNHVSGHRAGIAGVYNRAKYEGEMRQALQRWAEHIEAITSS
jgi:integrase